jgi:hypothetical protein
LETYYILHGYKRVDFFVDQPISGSDYENYKNLDFSQGVQSPGWIYLRNEYFSNDDDFPRTFWILFAHYVYKDGEKYALGCCSYYGILMHDQILIDLSNEENAPSIAAFRRQVLMHEWGHHINIIDWESGEEKYCSNPYCCMAKSMVVQGYNVNEAPWYCTHHWGQNSWPGW